MMRGFELKGGGRDKPALFFRASSLGPSAQHPVARSGFGLRGSNVRRPDVCVDIYIYIHTYIIHTNTYNTAFVNSVNAKP